MPQTKRAHDDTVEEASSNSDSPRPTKRRRQNMALVEFVPEIALQTVMTRLVMGMQASSSSPDFFDPNNTLKRSFSANRAHCAQKIANAFIDVTDDDVQPLLVHKAHVKAFTLACLDGVKDESPAWEIFAHTLKSFQPCPASILSVRLRLNRARIKDDDGGWATLETILSTKKSTKQGKENDLDSELVLKIAWDGIVLDHPERFEQYTVGLTPETYGTAYAQLVSSSELRLSEFVHLVPPVSRELTPRALKLIMWDLPTSCYAIRAVCKSKAAAKEMKRVDIVRLLANEVGLPETATEWVCTEPTEQEKFTRDELVVVKQQREEVAAEEDYTDDSSGDESSSTEESDELTGSEDEHAVCESDDDDSDDF